MENFPQTLKMTLESNSVIFLVHKYDYSSEKYDKLYQFQILWHTLWLRKTSRMPCLYIKQLRTWTEGNESIFRCTVQTHTLLSPELPAVGLSPSDTRPIFDVPTRVEPQTDLQEFLLKMLPIHFPGPLLEEACRKARLWDRREDLSGGVFCAAFLSEHRSGGIACPSRGSKFSLGVPTWALLCGAERTNTFALRVWFSGPHL